VRRAIRICLGDNALPIGMLRYDQQGARESAVFEYDAEWLGADERFSIDPTLQLVAGPQYHKRSRHGSVFHAAVADTEPDGWGRRVIQRDHAKRRQEAKKAGRAADTRPLNALDYLLAVDDVSRLGALRMMDEDGVFHRPSEEGRRTTPPLIELGALLAASRAIETNSDTLADLAYLRGRGTSLGGLRPKCSVIDNDGQLAIGKFPSVTDERAVTKGEVLALKLAQLAGIDAAEARLIDSDGMSIALIHRFDRVLGGGRLMYISAATMLGVEPDDPSEHAYTEIVDAIRVHGARAHSDIEELWRRIAFSILITNVDDHLRNHGFLHVDREQWRLAPAFDINPFPERLRELKLWTSEETGPEASIDALMSVAPYFRIARARAKEILGEVEKAVCRWREEGRKLGLSEMELEQFVDAFEHPERDRARQAMLS